MVVDSEKDDPHIQGNDLGSEHPDFQALVVGKLTCSEAAPNALVDTRACCKGEVAAVEEAKAVEVREDEYPAYLNTRTDCWTSKKLACPSVKTPLWWLISVLFIYLSPPKFTNHITA